VIRPETHVYVNCTTTLSSLIQLFSHRNKAVSDGATSFHLDHYVRTRVAKVTYGSKVDFFYDSLDAEHVKRVAKVYTNAVDGTHRLPEGFQSVLPKVKHFSQLWLYTLMTVVVVFKGGWRRRWWDVTERVTAFKNEIQ